MTLDFKVSLELTVFLLVNALRAMQNTDREPFFFGIQLAKEKVFVFLCVLEIVKTKY